MWVRKRWGYVHVFPCVWCAFCGNTVRNVTLSLWLVGHPWGSRRIVWQVEVRTANGTCKRSIAKLSLVCRSDENITAATNATTTLRRRQCLLFPEKIRLPRYRHANQVVLRRQIYCSSQFLLSLIAKLLPQRKINADRHRYFDRAFKPKWKSYTSDFIEILTAM